MEEKRKFIIIFRVILIFIFIYYLVALGGVIKNLLVKEYVDFPCSAEITSQGCLVTAPTHQDDGNREKRLEVFVTYYTAGVRGAGCEHLGTSKKKLNILGHLLEADGETLIINKDIKLAPNSFWQRERIRSFLNPWRIKKQFIKLKNYGIINCKMDLTTGTTLAYGPTMVVIGEAGTFYKVNWHGIIILIVLIASFVLSFILKKKDRV